ncbi:MAG: glycosyltransferase family 4 protein [Thermoplasmata archaeon]
MRVLEVTQRYPPALGGVEIQVQTIARGLSARGHTVEVVTTDLARDRPFTLLPTRPNPELFEVRRHRAVRWFPAPHGLGIGAPGMALDVLTADVDVVHAHAFGAAPTWYAALARRLRSTPLVIETHADAGRGTSGTGTYGRLVTRGTLTVADRIVAHTQLEADLLTSWGADRGRIAIIPNGVDLREFAQLPPRDPSRTGMTVLFVGRLYPEQKGLIPLVRGFARTPRELDLRLRIVGEDWGGLVPVLQLARELGVSDRVVATGALSRSDLLREYASADLFVLPSLFEPFGIVLLEAMAAGLPIVASRVGGVPEVVQEGENALLVPPNAPDELGGALAQLGGDPSLRARFSAHGREWVQKFSWDQILPQWIALFERMAERNR